MLFLTALSFEQKVKIVSNPIYVNAEYGETFINGKAVVHCANGDAIIDKSGSFLEKPNKQLPFSTFENGFFLKRKLDNMGYVASAEILNSKTLLNSWTFQNVANTQSIPISGNGNLKSKDAILINQNQVINPNTKSIIFNSNNFKVGGVELENFSIQK